MGKRAHQLAHAPTVKVVTKSGHTLTEDDIERLADEAERGFDLSTWRHERRLKGSQRRSAPQS